MVRLIQRLRNKLEQRRAAREYFAQMRWFDEQIAARRIRHLSVTPLLAAKQQYVHDCLRVRV